MADVLLPTPEFLSFCLLTLTAGKILGHEHGPGVVKVAVKEGSDVMLPCSLSTKESIDRELFHWFKVGQDDKSRQDVFLYDAGIHYNNGRPGQSERFKGRVSHFPDQLKHGNASIIITNTKTSDSGNYTCFFPHLRPPQTFYTELVVGASPEPYIRIDDVTESGVLLQCDVRGAFPQPKLQWKDSDGNVLPAEEPQVSDRGGRYDVTLQTTVTKTTTNSFHCVALQEEIHHTTHANITVPEKLFEDESWKGTTGWVVGFGWLFGGLFLGALILAAVLALLVATKRITIRCNRGSRQQENGSCNGASVPLQSSV